MDYKAGVIFMGNRTASMESNQLYSNVYKTIAGNQDLIIYYPGRKRPEDYKVEHNGKNTTHADIVRYLHDVALQNNASILVDYIMDIYNNGLYTNYNLPVNLRSIDLNGISLSTEQLKYIIYWVTLQEEINYPRPRYQGIKLPFSRYIEAIISANHPQIINLKQVLQRTNNHNSRLPINLKNPALPVMYENALACFSLI